MIGGGTTHSGLDRLTRGLLLTALVLTIFHHADHVLRVDHSGWPFREIVTPFTFSLLAYPMILFALFGPRGLYWLRWLLLAAGTGFTLYAHSALESPAMQYGMWAEGRSIEPALAHIHNIPGPSPVIGAVAVAVSMALNLVAIAATLAMLVNGLRAHRQAG